METKLNTLPIFTTFNFENSTFGTCTLLYKSKCKKWVGFIKENGDILATNGNAVIFQKLGKNDLFTQEQIKLAKKWATNLEQKWKDF